MRWKTYFILRRSVDGPQQIVRQCVPKGPVKYGGGAFDSNDTQYDQQDGLVEHLGLGTNAGE